MIGAIISTLVDNKGVVIGAIISTLVDNKGVVIGAIISTFQVELPTSSEQQMFCLLLLQIVFEDHVKG